MHCTGRTAGWTMNMRLRAWLAIFSSDARLAHVVVDRRPFVPWGVGNRRLQQLPDDLPPARWREACGACAHVEVSDQDLTYAAGDVRCRRTS